MNKIPAHQHAGTESWRQMNCAMMEIWNWGMDAIQLEDVV